MSDLIERLRRLYVQTGMNYVQEAADEIERLRAENERLAAELANLQIAFNDWRVLHSTIRMEAEIERLTAALKWEQHRAERQGTHGEGCANWGPAHYECLLRERDELRRQLAEAGKSIARQAATIRGLTRPAEGS